MGAGAGVAITEAGAVWQSGTVTHSDLRPMFGPALIQSETRTHSCPLFAMAEEHTGQEQEQEQERWLSKVHARWQGASSMTAARQKELVEEYVGQLPPLPYGCPRRTQPVAEPSAVTSEQRDQRVRLAPSTLLPPLTAVFIESSHASSGKRFVKFNPGECLLDYRGWILTEDEYDRFGYAIHTGVFLWRLYDDSDTTYVLMGDPTAPAAQINCIRGTGKSQPNAQLVMSRSQLQTKPDGQHYATDALVTVRATRVLKAGTEVWIDCGSQLSFHYYCPHCLEYDSGDEREQVLLCDAPHCMRAWHHRCLPLHMAQIPYEEFYCDLHAAQRHRL